MKLTWLGVETFLAVVFFMLCTVSLIQAVMYRFGLGVPKDTLEAIYWLVFAIFTLVVSRGAK